MGWLMWGAAVFFGPIVFPFYFDGSLLVTLGLVVMFFVMPIIGWRALASGE